MDDKSLNLVEQIRLSLPVGLTLPTRQGNVFKIKPYLSPMARKKQADFETSLNELEQLVQQMESGELNLEDSLKAFENGIKMIQSCQTSLNAAEQKVQILLEKAGQDRLTPFNENES